MRLVNIENWGKEQEENKPSVLVLAWVELIVFLVAGKILFWV